MRTCMCVLQRTFECLTSSLRSIRGSNSPAQHPWAHICALRVPNSHRRDREAHALRMGNMKRAIVAFADDRPFLFVASSVQAQAPHRPHVGRDTWYEFLLKQFNPSNFDYGAWLEKRRQAFLESTVAKPYFWYSATVTAGMLFVMVAYTKLYLDHRRSMRITAEMMADVYSHDLYSRQAATEAIEKYNRHIEQCNRVIESAESGDGRPGWGEYGGRRSEGRTAARRESTRSDDPRRNKLQEELQQKALVVADLSLRLDALSKKVNGAGHDGGSANQGQTDGRANGDGVQTGRAHQPAAGRVVCRTAKEQAVERFVTAMLVTVTGFGSVWRRRFGTEPERSEEIRARGLFQYNRCSRPWKDPHTAKDRGSCAVQRRRRF